MDPKEKFVLEFDEIPAFIYVAESPKVEHIYIKGNELKGWTSLELETNVEEVPNYKIEGFTIK